MAFRLNAQTDTSFNYRRPLFDFDYDKPVFKLENEQASNKNRALRYTVLTGYREGVEPILGQFQTNFKATIDKQKGVHKMVTFNLSLEELITGGPFLVQPAKVLFEVSDPAKFRYEPKYGDKVAWLRKNGYCLELAIPAGTILMTRFKVSEIKRLFNVEYGFEKRQVKALVLIRTSTADKIRSAGAQQAGTGKFMYLPFPLIVDRLNSLTGFPPFVDETGYTEPVDLDIEGSLGDVSALRKALQKYDLDLKEESRTLEMFVIREVKP